MVCTLLIHKFVKLQTTKYQIMSKSQSQRTSYTFSIGTVL